MSSEEWKELIRETKNSKEYHKLRVASKEFVRTADFLESIKMFVGKYTKLATTKWYDVYYDIVVKPILEENTIKIWF